MTNWIKIEHIDALPVRGSSLADIDMGRVERHIATGRGLVSEPPLDYLHRQSGLIEVDGETVPTLGGLLCFGKDPQRPLPHTGISLTRYAGLVANSQQVIDIRDLRGPLFELIDQADAYLWAQSNHGFRLDSGPRRSPFDQYPRTAIRELIVNAIAHRDYRVTGSRVKIEMFKNEIEWYSPGGLPSGITVENILKSQYTRNPVIVGFLFDAGYIEQRGMGLDTVAHVLREEQLPFPQMEDTGASFLIRIQGHGSVDKHTALGLDAPLAQIYTMIEGAGPLGMSSRDIADRLEWSIRTVNYRLQELIERKIVNREGATSRTRYYVREPDT
ncbi:winged helix-turn-helix transcriptional regulator [Oscillochloris sp. ZM17-4]|uniref:ATP-binding protein n=1 Tax=Oscillochloris sp. ZM17-4 TaxID=2866714 RepID=UPI001C73B54F|nr:ATP-binding protein [Oscillochloris sp. ZM17-4]MBX0328612.1 winged helix-turn-helix transcriptional regulator [Oscillochloris sp. ZM17-4]